MRTLRPGDHVRSPRQGGYCHHGIYVGDRTVIHYYGLHHSKAEASIRHDSIEKFSAGFSIEVCEYGACFDDASTVARATSRLGEHGYHVLHNNCEAFAWWCKTGHSSSAQVERAAAGAGAVIGTPAAASLALGALKAAGTGTGAAQLMAGLRAVAGSAAGGVWVAAALPAVVATVATHRVLRDDPHLPADEREARRGGRRASSAATIGGAAASVALISASGVPGLSAVGITSGLAAIGGTMAGGLFVAALIPAGLGALAGWLVHRAAKRR